MALIKRANDPCTFQIVQQNIPISTHNSTKIMDLSDSMSTTSSASPPSSQPKSGARRGRPRLTEDAELAKLVSSPRPVDGVNAVRNDGRNYGMHSEDCENGRIDI